MARQHAESKASKSTSRDSCCGGPAPAGSDACCVKDTEERAAGNGGCGCSCSASASR